MLHRLAQRWREYLVGHQLRSILGLPARASDATVLAECQRHVNIATMLRAADEAEENAFEALFLEAVVAGRATVEQRAVYRSAFGHDALVTHDALQREPA